MQATVPGCACLNPWLDAHLADQPGLPQCSAAKLLPAELALVDVEVVP